MKMQPQFNKVFRYKWVGLIGVICLACANTTVDNACNIDYSNPQILEISGCLLQVPEGTKMVQDTMKTDAYDIFIVPDVTISFNSGTTSYLPGDASSIIILDTVDFVIRSFERVQNRGKVHYRWYLTDYTKAKYFVDYADTSIIYTYKPDDLEKALDYEVLYPQKVLTAYVDASCVEVVNEIFHSVKYLRSK